MEPGDRIIEAMGNGYGFGPVEFSLHDPDRTWSCDGVTIDFSVQGDTYVLSVAPGD